MAMSAWELRWPRQSTSMLAASFSTLNVSCSIPLPRAVSLTMGASEVPPNAAAGMQLAARAFGQQRQVVGVEAEIEIEGARCAEFAIDGQPRVAGAKAQLVEGPVLALEQDAPTAGGGVAAKVSGEVAEGEIERAVTAKRRAARFHVEVERSVESWPQAAGIDSLHAARERPAFLGTPARLAGQITLAAECAEHELVHLQVILVQRAAYRDRHGIELRNEKIAAGGDGVRPKPFEVVLAFGAGKNLRGLRGETRREWPAKPAPVAHREVVGGRSSAGSMVPWPST